MVGALLDTHTLLWLVTSPDDLTAEALLAISAGQSADKLLVSPITAWELAVASQKPKALSRPDIGDYPPDQWFNDAIENIRARIVPIDQRIAVEAANVVLQTGHKDPGDTFLIATARVNGVPLVTRDGTIREVAAKLPGYLDLVVC